MGFNTTSSTLTIIAKLTPFGRQKLVSSNSSLFSTFSLGDSDANYYTTNSLLTGQVPSEGGDIGPNNSISNSTIGNVNLKSVLIVNGNGILKKSVESQSNNISYEIANNGQTTISGTNVTQLQIDRNNYNTDSLVNLFYTFGLPLNSSDDNLFTGITATNGGYSDTALSGLAVTKILVFSIDNSKYGESLDGKTIKLTLPTSAGTYNIYSTFQNKGGSIRIEDSNFRDTSINTARFGYNVSMMFSDTIMTPNGGSGPYSWATGFGTVKPFSLNGKQLYNFQTNPNVGLTADTVVGISYLDKGLIVITHPTIVNNYDSTTATGATITLDSVSTAIFQNITCIASRGEFGSSTNITFGPTDSPRISEVGLFDVDGNIIAFGKTDRHVVKNINEMLAIGVKIVL